MGREQRNRQRPRAIGLLDLCSLGVRQHGRQHVRRAIGEDPPRLDALLVALRLGVDMPHGGRMAGQVELDGARVAAEEHRSARLVDDLGELHRQHARAALDEHAARLEEAGLRDGEERPREVVGVVGVIADGRADRAFGRLVGAEEALEHVGGRGAPVAGERSQRHACAHELAEGPVLAGLVEPRDGVVDLLERAEEPRRTLADSAETAGSAHGGRRRSRPACRTPGRPDRPSPNRTAAPGPIRSRRECRVRSGSHA